MLATRRERGSELKVWEIRGKQVDQHLDNQERSGHFDEKRSLGQLTSDGKALAEAECAAPDGKVTNQNDQNSGEEFHLAEM